MAAVGCRTGVLAPNGLASLPPRTRGSALHLGVSHHASPLVSSKGTLTVRAQSAADGASTAASPVIDVTATTRTQTEADKLLGGFSVISAATGETVPLPSLWDSASPDSVGVLCFLTHFGDLTTAEYAQLIKRKILPEIGAQGTKVAVAAIGLGSVENAKKFAELFSFPIDYLFCDPDGEVYKALGFSPGFAPDAPVSPYLKLLPMLAGIGSPGTIQEVLRGYVGDRNRSPVFRDSTPFDVLGKGYQRPFELATQRLFNMNTVLANWQQLSPGKESLLTQQGGTLIFKGGKEVYFHKDSGILGYANVDDVISTLKSLAA